MPQSIYICPVNAYQSHIEKLQRQLEKARRQLIQHPLYAAINDLDALRSFSEEHVFAV